MAQTNRRVTLTAGVVFAVIAGLWSADLVLARIDNKETSIQARHFYDAGLHLLQANRPMDAVDELRKAHAMDRADARYSLLLAEALIQADKLDEAQTMLGEILERAPNGGQANLLEARLTARRGQFDEASAYYHRAIYGTWASNGAAQAIQARLELANLLASNGASRELLAELLSLEAAAPTDIGVRKQVARLFQAAGSPARAAEAYRGLIHDDPSDRSNDQGLGEAELALGDYQASENAFRNAGALPQSRLAAEMASLDPTIRRLSSAEKFRRSVRILELARDASRRCEDQKDDLLEAADRELASKVRGNITNEAAEERLTLAEQLWQRSGARCSGSGDDALSRLMQKLKAS